MVMMYALCASCTMTLHDSRASLINNRKSIEKFVQNNTLQKVLCSVEFEKLKLNSIPDWSGAEKFGGGYYPRHLTQNDYTAAQQASRAAAAVLKQALERQADQALSDFMATLLDEAMGADASAATVSGQEQQLSVGADADNEVIAFVLCKFV